MGLFSFVGDVIGDITGTNKAADKAAAASREASSQALGFQQQGLDYLKEVQQPVLDIRNQALPQLYGFFDPSNPAGQQQVVNAARSSPFYNQLVDVGEEAVLRNAAATGNLRGGDVKQALARSNQDVLRKLVGQQLQGLGSFAQTPIDTSGIAGQLNRMGQTQAQGTIAQGQAYQDAAGQNLSTLSALGRMALGGF